MWIYVHDWQYGTHFFPGFNMLNFIYHIDILCQVLNKLVDCHVVRWRHYLTKWLGRHSKCLQNGKWIWRNVTKVSSDFSSQKRWVVFWKLSVISTHLNWHIIGNWANPLFCYAHKKWLAHPAKCTILRRLWYTNQERILREY